jgi:hypothetical protein
VPALHQIRPEEGEQHVPASEEHAADLEEEEEQPGEAEGDGRSGCARGRQHASPRSACRTTAITTGFTPYRSADSCGRWPNLT